jgi:metallo-beta-lactamase class B
MIRAVLLLLVANAAHLTAQRADTTAPPPCQACARWNTPQKPFRIYGNAYYVGTRYLGAILITSDRGHILIDAALKESVPQISANIESLGFKVADIKFILNSHVHYDHAGGIAEMARRSGAVVTVSPASAKVLRRGDLGEDDPQFRSTRQPLTPIANVRVVADNETLRLGSTAVTAHFTAGHTPGGTTWTWRSCAKNRCVDVVYADSETPVSADDFLFTKTTTYPTALADFEKAFAFHDRIACDILVAPHPELVDLWSRLEKREAGNADALIDPTACKRFAAEGRKNVAARVAREKP